MADKDKFDEAKRLFEESVETFKAAHNAAELQLENTADLAQRNAIRAAAHPVEQEALEQAREAIKLHHEAIAEVPPPASDVPNDPGGGEA